jgi:hypothetical protein
MRQLQAEEPDDDMDIYNDMEMGDDRMPEEEPLPEDDEDPTDDFSQGDMAQGDLSQGDLEQPELDPDEEPEEEPSEFEGVVRSVKGAVLVSKKQQPDETYTEVWMYNAGKKYKHEANIRRSVLSGTDIDPSRNFSEDGSQEATIVTLGNIQYMTLSGIPD